MHTKGRTFGLTFYENYYIVGQNPEFQFIRYIGHTVQGGYKGAFVLARSNSISPESLVEVHIRHTALLTPALHCISQEMAISPQRVLPLEGSVPWWLAPVDRVPL